MRQQGFKNVFLRCMRYSVYVLCKTKWFSPSFHTCRRLPLVSSFSTTSDISNSLRGRGIFLLAATVFSRPGSKVVRATWWWQTMVRPDTKLQSFIEEKSALFWKYDCITWERGNTHHLVAFWLLKTLLHECLSYRMGTFPHSPHFQISFQVKWRTEKN